MSLQIIVICASELRKKYMEKQFEEFYIPFPVHFFEASTPENSKDYLIGFDNTDYWKKVICATRSHARAIENAGLTTSPEFTIILEDDVAFHKTKFFPVVEELRLNWDNIIPPHVDYVSLGWIMGRPHEGYSKLCTSLNLASYQELGRFDLMVHGAQAYMLKRSTAAMISPIINKSTFNEMKETVMAKNYPELKGCSWEAIALPDKLLQRILFQWNLFPSLAIEYEGFASTVGNNNYTLCWNNYFAGREEDKLIYYSPDKK